MNNKLSRNEIQKIQKLVRAISEGRKAIYKFQKEDWPLIKSTLDQYLEEHGLSLSWTSPSEAKMVKYAAAGALLGAGIGYCNYGSSGLVLGALLGAGIGGMASGLTVNFLDDQGIIIIE